MTKSSCPPCYPLRGADLQSYRFAFPCPRYELRLQHLCVRVVDLVNDNRLSIAGTRALWPFRLRRRFVHWRFRIWMLLVRLRIENVFVHCLLPKPQAAIRPGSITLERRRNEASKAESVGWKPRNDSEQPYSAVILHSLSFSAKIHSVRENLYESASTAPHRRRRLVVAF